MHWIPLIVLLIVNSPIYFLLLRVFFRTGEELDEAVAALFKFQWNLTFRDWIAKTKLSLCLIACILLTAGEYKLVIHYWG